MRLRIKCNLDADIAFILIKFIYIIYFNVQHYYIFCVLLYPTVILYQKIKIKQLAGSAGTTKIISYLVPKIHFHCGQLISTQTPAWTLQTSEGVGGERTLRLRLTTMEYNNFGEYVELDENIEIEDFGDVEEFFEDPAIQFMKTKQEPEYQQTSQQIQEMRIFYENKAAKDEMKIVSLETQYKDLLTKHNSLTEQFSLVKENNTPSERDTVRHLQERVLLIKEKAKEKLAEKDETILELNEKIKNYEEMLNVVEVNCKKAVLKLSEFQQEIAKKDEQLQEHFSFKNRYDYTINYLTEKCQKVSDTYQRQIKELEEKLRGKQPSSAENEKMSLTEAIIDLSAL